MMTNEPIVGRSLGQEGNLNQRECRYAAHSRISAINALSVALTRKRLSFVMKILVTDLGR